MFLYKYLKNNEVIYIGKTKRDVNKRVCEHFIKKDLPDDADIFVYKCDTEAFMNVMEILLIDKYRPKYNKDCNPIGWEKANISFNEPEFIPLKEYNKQNVPVEYINNNGDIVAIMTDGSQRKPEYCQCEEGCIPQKTYSDEGDIYDICFLCGKLIKNTFKNINI